MEILLCLARRSLPVFAELADSVHFYGAKIFIQLSPGLGRALPGDQIDSGVKPVAASEGPYFLETECQYPGSHYRRYP